jgi:hypothetical protein
MRFENTKILWTMLINRKGCHMIAMTKLKWHLGITEQFYILGLDKEVVICVGKREKEERGGGGGGGGALTIDYLHHCQVLPIYSTRNNPQCNITDLPRHYINIPRV